MSTHMHTGTRMRTNAQSHEVTRVESEGRRQHMPQGREGWVQSDKILRSRQAAGSG